MRLKNKLKLINPVVFVTKLGMKSNLVGLNNALTNELTLVVIKGIPVYCLIDAGSSCSLMPERTASLIGCHIEPYVSRLKGLGSGHVKHI